MDEQYILELARLSARTLGPDHRPAISPSHAHARVVDENPQHATGFLDATAARHGSLHQAALYRADSVLVPGWVRRAAPRFLAKDEGNGATDRGTGESPAE